MEIEHMRLLWDSMKLQLNEMQLRHYAATLAKTYGYGGATVVHKITGISLNTITAGKKELARGTKLEAGRVRKQGGGPKWLEERHPDIEDRLRDIIDGSTYGNPEKMLSWTTESLRSIQKVLDEKYNIHVNHVTIGSILESSGTRKNCAIWRLQSKSQHWFCKCRNKPRYSGICG
jgi:hypothetical protein